ncbi:MAG TPA: ABC transporter ATP-binding protein [Gemmatimonadaceae bacterium]
MIAFRDVSVRYPRPSSAAAEPARDALHHVSFEARAGRVTAVVGPNGSGKSTTVRALLGRLPLARGEVTLDGTPLDALSRAEVARRVAAVTQREELTFPLPVHEYVALGRYPHMGAWAPAGAADRAAVERAIALADVGALRDRRVDALSGGEWQRVRLARALAQQGRALVLDEPTTFLDIAHEMSVFELLAQLAHGHGLAVLLVSHQLNLVARFADHLVLLQEGQIVAAGTPSDVMQGEILERVYGWPLVVTRDPAVGAPSLVPLRGRVRR